MATTTPSVSPLDRLSFAGFLAVSLHAVIILGVTFTLATRGPSTHTMEVTLVPHRSDSVPGNRDYLAQFDQEGSGTLERKTMTTTTSLSDFHDTEIRDTPPRPEPQPLPREQSITAEPVLSSNSRAQHVVMQQRDEEKKPDVTETAAVEQRIVNPSLDIASLMARLDRERQINARRPRVKRLTSLSTRASADAFYLNSWRRKVETVGNLNYPEEARRRKLYGSLRLLVSILPDGKLKEVEILESSGYRVLDDAAVRIVRLSAPFAPFPDELRQTTDVLEIIRTWQFRKNSSLYSF